MIKILIIPYTVMNYHPPPPPKVINPFFVSYLPKALVTASFNRSLFGRYGFICFHYFLSLHAAGAANAGSGGGGGVASTATFIHQGGTIYGSDALTPADRNTIESRDITVGAAVYVKNSGLSNPYRETTLGETDNLSYIGTSTADDAGATLSGDWNQ
jgi:hypothetical protein